VKGNLLKLLLDQVSVKVFVADTQLESRRQIRTALKGQKINEFREYKDFNILRSDLEFAYPDLVIIDTDLPGGDVCELIHDIRYKVIGPNPFVPIIAMTWDRDKASIRKIIDSGVDGLLLKPMASNEIIKYVEMLTHDRKKFVVTSSYIGPDRRKEPSRAAEDGLLDVPNTLKTKRSGEQVNIAKLSEWISERMGAVNEERLRKNATDISLLLSIVLPQYRSGKITDQTRTHLTRILEVAEDISKRTKGSDFDHISSLCSNMVNVARSVCRLYRDPPKKDLKLIKPLSDAILAGLHPDKDEAELAAEISASVQTFKKFQKAS
jgi:DNA-binding NarL/FixJ family response regulator